MSQGYRGRLRGDLAPAGQELDFHQQEYNRWRESQHKEDGSHGDVTADGLDLDGPISIGGPFNINSDFELSPPQIVANQNDYNPPGLEDAEKLRLSTDASRTITGIKTDPRYPRYLRIVNVGNFDLVFAHNSTSSTQLYRIGCPLSTNITVGSGGSLLLYYDIHAGNWRVLDATGAVSGASSTAPYDADFLVKTANGTLTAERVVTDNTAITFDWSVAGQVKAVLGAHTGDVTSSSNNLALTIANDAVTYAKMQNVSAASKLLGRGDSGSGDPQELSLGSGLSMSGTTLSASGSVSTVTHVIGITVDGGGSAITTGVKGYVHIPFACTLDSWRILADQSGAIKFDVWKDTYTNYPPDNSDSITNGHEPEITASGTKAEDTNITDWTTTSVSSGDVIGFNVDSCTSITRATLEIKTTGTT